MRKKKCQSKKIDIVLAIIPHFAVGKFAGNHLAIRSKVFLSKTDCTPPTPPSAPPPGGDSLLYYSPPCHAMPHGVVATCRGPAFGRNANSGITSPSASSRCRSGEIE